MSDTRANRAVAIGRTDSNDSLILMTSPQPAEMSFIRESPGDLFDAPNGAALIHACNCQGAWGAGIAREFRNRYPAAYEIYRKHCLQYLENRQTQRIPNISNREPYPSLVVQRPLGTALIIPPQESDFARHRRRHWIICLFTSKNYGSHVDSEGMIVSSTFAALQHLREQLCILCRRLPAMNFERPLALYSSRFCTGLFHVPWERIRRMIVELCLPITVYHPFEPSVPRARPIRVQRPPEGHQE
ncbi:hypothetical protein N7475_010050 [Penicillium sp. IBT 31633x]|nr:hypothetical protein N7475_010050 [Penicillium sp. IBT 31633x]